MLFDSGAPKLLVLYSYFYLYLYYYTCLRGEDETRRRVKVLSKFGSGRFFWGILAGKRMKGCESGERGSVTAMIARTMITIVYGKA